MALLNVECGAMGKYLGSLKNPWTAIRQKNDPRGSMFSKVTYTKHFIELLCVTRTLRKPYSRLMCFSEPAEVTAGPTT